MAFRIGGRNFTGPSPSKARIKNRSGVYAVLTKVGKGKFKVLDIGESAKVRTRLNSHDRSDCWSDNAQGKLYYAVHYTPYAQRSGRRRVEQPLRAKYDPTCGVR